MAVNGFAPVLLWTTLPSLTFEEKRITTFSFNSVALGKICVCCKYDGSLGISVLCPIIFLVTVRYPCSFPVRKPINLFSLAVVLPLALTLVLSCRGSKPPG